MSSLTPDRHEVQPGPPADDAADAPLPAGYEPSAEDWREDELWAGFAEMMEEQGQEGDFAGFPTPLID